MTTEEYLELKGRVESLQRDLDRAQGAKVQSKRQLKKEFNVSNLKEARALQQQLNTEIESLEKTFDKNLEEFNEQYREKL